MLKFGKKINYRPLLISLLVATLVGLVFGLNATHHLGWVLGIIIFLIIFLGYYLVVLPIIFSYWNATDSAIHYSDLRHLHQRLFSMFFPRFSSIKTVAKAKIVAIKITGLPQRSESLATDLVISEEGGFMYNILLMINEPVKIKLVTVNQQTITLDLSYDYVEHPAETIGKLKIFLRDFRPGVLQLSDETKVVLIE